MEKTKLDSLKATEILKPSDGYSTVYVLSNDKVLKLFNPQYVEAMKRFDSLDIEKKILCAKPLKGIITPNQAVYYPDNRFAGYTQNKASGINLENFIKTIQISNLKGYANLYKLLETTVKNLDNVVLSDICTLSNCYIDKRNIQFLDYDDIQVDNFKTPVISTAVETLGLTDSTKYYNNGLYTKNLDIKSLIHLYFLMTFNVDLLNVGKMNPSTGKIITLEEIFDIIGLDDVDLMHKVWLTFTKDKENIYLGDSVYEIADKYKMNILGKVDCAGETGYLKKLIRK